MTDLTTQEAVENYLLIEVDNSFQSQITSWISTISKYIENETGRIFAKSDSEERLFDGSGARELVIDDLLEITKIEVNDTEMDLDNYYLYPANETPKTLIKGHCPSGYQNIKITGKWGYSEEAPEDVAFACTVLVAGIIQQSIDHEGEVKSEKVGEWSVTYKDENQWNDFAKIDDILEKYKRY